MSIEDKKKDVKNEGIPLNVGISMYQQKVSSMTNELIKACESTINPLAGFGYYGMESMLQTSTVKNVNRYLKIIKIEVDKIEKEIDEYNKRQFIRR